MTGAKPESIWTRAFALLCLAEFLGYAQHFVLQPTFPLYITHLGGSQILALAMEKAPVERRARAMASFSVSFPLSNGTGALLNGFVVDLAGYTSMYVTAAVMCASGLVLTWKQWPKLK